MNRRVTSKKIFPFLNWELSRPSVRADFFAGLTVALVLIPQSMAYAQLAGLPVVVGLYASFLPVIFGALWGASHHLQSGPVAMTSLLTAATLVPLAAPETAEYVVLAGALALLLGVIRLLIGFFRLAEIANFLSKPVLDGFIHAGVLVIASSQISKLFGLQMDHSGWYLRDLWQLLLDLPQANWLALLLGTGSIALLAVLKKVAPKLPAALFVVAGTTGLVYLTGWSDPARVAMPVSVVGNIPQGLPDFRLALPDGAQLLKMIPGALAITFIGFMEMCGVAKAVAAKSKQALDLNQEMIGQGASALAAGLTGGYPVSGSLSRTALNYSAGARTGLSSVFTGLIVAAFLMFMAGALHFLPQAALGAIIIVAVVKLLDFRRLFFYWKISRIEGFIATCTFVSTLCFAPQLQNGILAGVALSMFYYLFSCMKPNVSLRACDASRITNDVSLQELAAAALPVMRFDGRLFFANASYFEEELLRVLEACPESRFIGIDAKGINSIDATGVDLISALVPELRRNGVELIFCGLKPAVLGLLERGGVIAEIGEQNLYPHLNAVQKGFFSRADATG